MDDLENNQAPETSTISDVGTAQLADNVVKSEKATVKDTLTVKTDIIRSRSEKATVKDTLTVLLDAAQSHTERATVSESRSLLVQTQGPTLWFALGIPAIELSASILQGAVLRFPLEVPVLEISGSIKSGGKLSASLPVPAIEVSLGIAPRNEIDATLRIPALQLSGAIISGGVISVPIEIPTLGLVLAIGHQNQLIFALDVPFIDPWLEIRGLPAFVPFRKGFVVNLAHFGVTEYSGYSFNSLCDYHGTGIYIGASENGIFLLDGDDDNGVKIDAVIMTGTEDLWAGVMKRLREGFVSMRGGEISLELILDEGRLDSVTRDLQSVREVIHEERFKTPRGLKNRFFSVIIKNIGGSDFSLESLRIFSDIIRRKAR